MVAIQIRIDLGPPARRAVFALLALVKGKPVPRAEPITTLWGDDPPPSATDVLRTHVEHLRRLLEPGREARAPRLPLPGAGDGYAPLLIPGWTALCGP